MLLTWQLPRLWIQICIVLGAILSSPVQAEPISEDQVRQLYQQAIPLVEKYTGKKFITKPALFIGTAEEKMDNLRRFALNHFGQDEFEKFETYSALPSPFGYPLAWRSASHAAYYPPANQVSIVFPDFEKHALTTADASVGISAEFVALLTLCHELVHALQAQESNIFDLSPVENTVDPQKREIVKVMTEGQAVYFTNQIAFALRLGAHVEWYTSRLQGPYLLGLNFTQEIAKRRPDYLWLALKSPPPDTFYFRHPQDYLEGLKAGEGTMVGEFELYQERGRKLLARELTKLPRQRTPLIVSTFDRGQVLADYRLALRPSRKNDPQFPAGSILSGARAVIELAPKIYAYFNVVEFESSQAAASYEFALRTAGASDNLYSLLNLLPGCLRGIIRWGSVLPEFATVRTKVVISAGTFP